MSRPDESNYIYGDLERSTSIFDLWSSSKGDLKVVKLQGCSKGCSTGCLSIASMFDWVSSLTDVLIHSPLLNFGSINLSYALSVLK